MSERCRNQWSIHTVEGWHKVTVEHDCTKTAGHDRVCRCACGMPDPAAEGTGQPTNHEIRRHDA